MKIISILRTTLVIVVLISNTAIVNAVELIPSLSRINLKGIDGKDNTFGEILTGKPLYIKFWASWCQTCLKQMPHFQEVTEKYKNKLDVVSINIDINDDIGHIIRVKEKFGLTAPILMDESGRFAQLLDFQGTPYHVVIDSKGELVHKGYEVDEHLDSMLFMVSSGDGASKSKNSVSAAETEKLSTLPLMIKDEDAALYFFAPWCEWYLEQTRPDASKNCLLGQKVTNKMYQRFPAANWYGISTRLWTTEKELIEYKNKHSVQHDLIIDGTNEVFLEYGIKDFPTLIVLRGGKEIFRTTEFKDDKKIAESLRSILE